MGSAVGLAAGLLLGLAVGLFVGTSAGLSVGLAVGSSVGHAVGFGGLCSCLQRGLSEKSNFLPEGMLIVYETNTCRCGLVGLPCVSDVSMQTSRGACCVLLGREGERENVPRGDC